MSLLAILATIFGTLSGVANIPQVYKIFKRKSAGDISIVTYLIVFVAIIFWTLYGFELKNPAIIIPNFFAFFSVGAVIIGWFKYGRNNK